MVPLNQTDISVRLQLLNCKIGEHTINLLNEIKIGASDTQCSLTDLQVLQGMFDAIKCYDIDSTTNCLTEKQVQLMIDYMAKKCNQCFQPIGFTYTEYTGPIIIGKSIYWGSNASSNLNSANVQLLQNTSIALIASGSKIFNANNYKYYSYPASFGLMTNFIDTLTNFNVPMNTMYTVTISGVIYNVHRTFYPIISSITIQIS